MPGPYVFRSFPHLPVFQDFTESRPEIAEEYEDPEDAAEVYYALFAETAPVYPLPQFCVFIDRKFILCRECGVNLKNSSPFLCDPCTDKYFDPVKKKIEEAAREKLEREARQKKKGKEKEGGDEAFKPKPRKWKPEVMKAPRKRKGGGGSGKK